MNLDRLPRWFLVVVAGCGLGACGILVTTARADLDRFKGIAEDAQETSQENSQSIVELKQTVGEIKSGQEIFRKEYREDRIRDAQQLQAMEERIIRAVKK